MGIIVYLVRRWTLHKQKHMHVVYENHKGGRVGASKKERNKAHTAFLSKSLYGKHFLFL